MRAPVGWATTNGRVIELMFVTITYIKRGLRWNGAPAMRERFPLRPVAALVACVEVAVAAARPRRHPAPSGSGSPVALALAGACADSQRSGPSPPICSGSRGSKLGHTCRHAGHADNPGTAPAAATAPPWRRNITQFAYATR
jgi:hypothetical protein